MKKIFIISLATFLFSNCVAGQDQSNGSFTTNDPPSSSIATKKFAWSMIPVSWSTWHADESIEWNYSDFKNAQKHNGNIALKALGELRPEYKIAQDSFSTGIYAGLDFVVITSNKDMEAIKNDFRKWSAENSYGTWVISGIDNRQYDTWISPNDWPMGGSKYFFIDLKNKGLVLIQRPAVPQQSGGKQDFSDGLDIFFNNFHPSDI